MLANDMKQLGHRSVFYIIICILYVSIYSKSDSQYEGDYKSCTANNT